jgi:hypothetical protein
VASLRHIPKAYAVGSMIAKSLEPFVQAIASDWEPMANGSMVDPFTDDAVEQARKEVLKTLGMTQVWPSRSQIRADVVKAQIEASSDPDIDIPQWLRYGCPMGISTEIPYRHIFPPVSVQDGEDLPDMQKHEVGWTNYGSAEQNLDIVQDLLATMADNDWLREHDTIEQYLAASGCSEAS